MKTDSLILFTPSRHRGGYQAISGLATARGVQTKTILRSVDPNARIESYQAPDDLYVRFARTAPTADGIKTFADRHGLLGLPPVRIAIEAGEASYTSLPGEPLDGWRAEIADMNRALECWRAVQTAKPSALARMERLKGPAKHRKPRDWEKVQPGLALDELKQLIDAHPSKHGMVKDRGTLRYRIVPANLLEFLWQQLATDVSADKVVRQCANCSRWIVVAPGTRSFRRSTCSDSCRSRLYQKKSS